MHILLTSAGRRVGLMRTLRTDALSLGIKPLLFAADMAPELSAACADADRALMLPPCAHPEYVEELVKVCAQNRVGLVIPTIDTELLLLACARDRFASKAVTPVISRPEAITVARDKHKTADLLAAAGVPTPLTTTLADLLAGRRGVRFPAVLKRVDGSRSVGLHYADSIAATQALGLDATRYIAQERCIGPEYTVNCYVDQQGKLRAAVPHRRIEVRDGEVSKGVTERRADLTAIAHKIVAAIPGLRGPFCFQAILTEEGPKVFEINARFGGGYPLAHAAGATFGKWLIEETLGLPCTANDEWQDGLLMLRYDAAVFVKQ